MPTTKAHKTRHHSNLRPQHKHTKKYLQAYWPYLPLLTIIFMIIAVLQPWHMSMFGGKVLPYATNVSLNQLLEETNEQREQHSQRPLKLNRKLSQAAQNKAKDMVTRDYWSHNTPDGNAPWVFVTSAGYEYQKAGENLAYGFLSSQQVVSGWMNSQSHRANILDTSYEEVGFGFADSANFIGNGPSTIVVAMYGRPLSSPPVAAGSEDSKITTDVETFSSLANVAGSTNPQNISRVQTFFGTSAPWAAYIASMIAGAALMYLAIKHAIGLRRLFKRGERYVIKHPIFDATLISLVILITLVIQRVGVVL